MIKFWNGFVKLTAWFPQLVVFRPRITYENKSIQGRRISGPAIIVCNHRSVFDLAAILFTFFSRTVRFQIAELQFEKKLLGKLLRGMGGIRVDRFGTNMSFMAESEAVLRKGGVIGIFPEGRLPRSGEITPLPFRPGAAYLSIISGVKIIPVYTVGSYFSMKRNRVVIGTPIDPALYLDGNRSEKDAISLLTEDMRNKIINLEKTLHDPNR